MATQTKGGGVTDLPTGVEVVHDLGEGMTLCLADLASLREQDVNARILPTAEHNTLVNNIRRRGRMESVPYCVLQDGRVEIVSGHHRIRAAREAGITQAPVLIDTSGLSRSEIVAKQLAHNRLQGTDDPDTLRRLFDMLATPDEILETGLGGELLELPNVDLETGITPHMDMNWKVVTLTFLPHQLAHLQALLDDIPASDLVGVADIVQYEPFMEAVLKYARFRDVRNVGTALALLAELALREAGKLDAEEAPDGG